jgi:Leucine-rich repeat (LRR) protein
MLGVSVYALKQLWNAWNATPDVQTNLAGWNALAEEPLKIPCVPDTPWRGVYCNAKSNSTLSSETNLTGWDIEITGLALSNASLTGVIPDGIGNLTNLVTLTVTNNRDLTGDLPIGMQTLYSLFDMDLHGNNITGSFPLWDKNSFAFLQNINLADNKMVGGLPSNITSSFRALQTVNLSHNLFTGDFYAIDVFSYLHKLVLV